MKSRLKIAFWRASVSGLFNLPIAETVDAKFDANDFVTGTMTNKLHGLKYLWC